MIYKKKIKLYLIGINILLIGILSIPTTLGQITIYDSSFPMEQGKTIRWETVNATESPYNDFEYVRFTVNGIYNDTFGSFNSLIVNYTLEFYHNFGWIPKGEDYFNAFYLAYNHSMNYLNISKLLYLDALPLIIPTPVNLSLVGDTIEMFGPLNYSFNDLKLTLDYRNTTTVEITYNSRGISKIIEKITNRTTMFKWQLVTSDVLIIIPFNNYFILIASFTAGLLAWYEIKRRKIKLKG